MPANPPDPNARQGLTPDSIVFGQFTGLKNTVGPERLAPTELESALNIDLDDVGQVRRRRGFVRKLVGSFHSLFTANDGTVYCVKDGSLGKLNPDYSFVVLQTGVGTDPTKQLAYAQVGETIYFSGPVAGKIKAGVVSAWGPAQDIWVSPVVNPTSTLPAVNARKLGAPPLANWLTYFSGRIYLAQDTTLWATELYLYDFVDKTKNFIQFESTITGLAALATGIYVGTTDGVYWLSGLRPSETMLSKLRRVKVLDSPMIPGSVVYLPTELANPPQIGLDQDTPAALAILFMTTTGYCGGQEGGTCYNFTETKMVFPDAHRAAAMYRRQDGVNAYIAVTDSGGSPSASTRIGDFVDAEIIRGGGPVTGGGPTTWDTIADVLKLGDRFDILLLDSNTIPDGLVLGETVVADVIHSGSLSDGLGLSEVSAVDADADGHLADGLVFVEGFTADVIAGPNSDAASDGLVFGEGFTVEIIYSGSLSDGLGLSQVPAVEADVSASLSDGLSFGEALTVNTVTGPDHVADTVDFGSTLAVEGIYAPSRSESAAVGSTATFAVVKTGSVAESAVAVDAEVSRATYGSTRSESTTVGESSTTTVVRGPSSVAESSVPTASATAKATFASARAESWAVNFTATATVTPGGGGGGGIVPAAPMMVWATPSSDTTPDFDVDLPSGVGDGTDAQAGDVLRIQYSLNGWVTSADYVVHTLSSGDIVADTISETASAIAGGVYVFRARLERTTGNSLWTADVAVTI